MVKGEALEAGINKILDGVELVQQSAGDSAGEIIKYLIKHEKTVRKLRDVIHDTIFVEFAVAMTRNALPSKHQKLSDGTIKEIIQAFLSVMFDLAQPLGVDEEQ